MDDISLNLSSMVKTVVENSVAPKPYPWMTAIGIHGAIHGGLAAWAMRLEHGLDGHVDCAQSGSAALALSA
jgi:hypothetical protein